MKRVALGVAAFALYVVLLFGARVTLWHDALLFPCALWLAMRAIEPVAARHRTAAIAAVATAFLSIGLFYVWTVGWGGRNHVFGGVFALSDAGEYYWDAERVLHGATMNTGGARRPIFSAVLAGVFRITGNDIYLAHYVTMLVWALCGAFAVAEVWRTHGHRTASIVLVLFVLFARRYVGFVQSEGIGAPLGALAFGLLWRVQSMTTEHAGLSTEHDSAGTKPRWHATYLGALLLQSVALLARPGPIFVIVAMVFWGVRRADRNDRTMLLAKSIGCVAFAFAFQHLVRTMTAGSASFSDLPPILYGLVHGEDSQFVWAHNPSLGELPESARAGAIWTLLRHDLLESPALIVLAPLRCLATWLYLPQGLFGMVWLNPDDRALESAAAVKQSMADHGYVGPLFLWVQKLGAYSLVNAIAMAIGGIAFIIALLRSAWKAWRARRSETPPFFVAVLLGVLVSLPFLPPWITEGAQILASVFFFVVTFAVTSFLPPRTAPLEKTSEKPWLGPAVVAALAVLVAVARLLPVRPAEAPCRDDGAYLADVDRSATVTYGAVSSRLRLADSRANVGMLEKNNRAFAGAIDETLGTPHRIFPAYDACKERMLYVVEEAASADSNDRWRWLRTTPMAQKPLERLTPSPAP
jgi:hypothetical protein